jgi:hypothetical protein
MSQNIFNYFFDFLEESPRITRQFKRIGNNIKRQFRCMSGDKQGRLVSDASKCGIRKDPKRVRQGKIFARHKKAQKIRKSKRTKAKPFSRRLVKFNDFLKGKLNEK